jgi:glycosyltransferase involved in cell wall biosynthesis/GT2 family glycosyltransferase
MTYRLLFAYPEVAPLFTNGGIGTFVFEAASLLAASGQWEVDILTDTSYVRYSTSVDFRNAEATFRENGIRLFDLDRDDRVPLGWGSPDVTRAERYQRHVARLHAERQYHLIEFPDWRAPGFFVVRHKRTAGAFTNTQLVVHLHSSTQDVWAWQDRYFLDRDDLYCHYMEHYVKKYSDLVLSPTEFLLQPVRHTQSVFRKAFFRSGYPMSSSHQPALKDIRSDRKTEAITVACISRLELRKGQDVLAQAIRHLVESPSLDSRVQYVFCGRDSLGLDRDGWMSQSIRRILHGIGNWKMVSPKSRAELAQWLATEVDICVVPSRSDNYPNVVLEAARAGCYVIASDTGGIPEIFADYEIAGALFAPGDPRALEQEIVKAVHHIRRHAGIRLWIAERFEENRRKQVQHMLGLYEAMVRHRKTYSAPSRLDRAKPLVSIVIPFYNAHRYAREAIQSAFASNYPDFEVILVNDGSDDPKALEFLKKVEAEYPKLNIIHKSNGGLGDARNAGIKAASGEFIVPLDADNLLLPDMVRSCSDVLAERQHLAYVTTYFECLREDGARVPWQLAPIAKPLGAVDPLLLLEPTVGDALGMIRRSALDAVGGYSTMIYCFEDWDVWLKFHERGMEGDVLPEVHFIYRLRSDSMSRSLDAAAGVRLQQAMLRKHEGLVREQSLAITTLLLQEYWPRWRGSERRGAETNAEADWDVFKMMVYRAMHDPRRALRYVTGELRRRWGERVRNLNPVKGIRGLRR